MKTQLALEWRDSKWPLGQPEDEPDGHQRFCAQPRKPGKPYCPDHCATAYEERRAAPAESNPPEERAAA